MSVKKFAFVLERCCENVLQVEYTPTFSNRVTRKEVCAFLNLFKIITMKFYIYFKIKLVTKFEKRGPKRCFKNVRFRGNFT